MIKDGRNDVKIHFENSKRIKWFKTERCGKVAWNKRRYIKKSYPDIPILKKIEKLYKLPYSRIIFLPLDYDKTVNII